MNGDSELQDALVNLCRIVEVWWMFHGAFVHRDNPPPYYVQDAIDLVHMESDLKFSFLDGEWELREEEDEPESTELARMVEGARK